MSERKDCPHCSNGWFDPKSGGFYFGQDVECVNGVLIDIDEYTEGHSPDVLRPVAPCHPCWTKQQKNEDFENDSQERLNGGGQLDERPYAGMTEADLADQDARALGEDEHDDE